MTTITDEMVFTQYRRTQIAEMMPWVEGFDMNGVSVSAPDREAGSPKVGDMIARNPKNHADRWLVAAKYFADNFEPLSALPDGWAVVPSGKESLPNEMVKAGETEFRNLRGFNAYAIYRAMLAAAPAPQVPGGE